MIDGATTGSPAKTTEEVTVTMCPRSTRMTGTKSGATPEAPADAAKPAEKSMARPTTPRGCDNTAKMNVCPSLTGTADTMTGATPEALADALKPAEQSLIWQTAPVRV